MIDKLDTESEKVTPLSQRSWAFEFNVPKGEDIEFRFPTVATAFIDATVSNKRYDDADLIDAAAVITLQQSTINWLPYIYSGAGVITITLMIPLILRRKKTTILVSSTHQLPDNLTPFSLLSFLRHIESDKELNLTKENRDSLQIDINTVEQAYFSLEKSSELNIPQIAKKYKKFVNDYHSQWSHL